MKHFILDANNIIHVRPEWRSLLHKAPDAARNALLISVIDDARRHPGYTFTVVFDGAPSPYLATGARVKTICSGARTTADEVIKRIIRSEQDPHQCIVVSSDTEIHNFARRNACTPLSSTAFLHRLLSVIQPATADAAKREDAEQDEKPAGVSHAELKEMKRLFGIK